MIRTALHRNEKGQILLPGLAVFLGLLFLFFSVVYMGRVKLMRMRMETAAQAAALSAVRAQAQMLNQCAGYNLTLFALAPNKKGFATTQISLKSVLELHINAEKFRGAWDQVRAGMLGFPVSVGNVVARLNGANPIGHWPPRLDPYLKKVKLTVMYLSGIYFAGFGRYNEAVYVRTWKGDQSRAQPTHTASWCVENGKVQTCATAKVYLDISEGVAHNGGFPRESQKIFEDVLVVPALPQFNARLTPFPLRRLKTILRLVGRIR